eukprot:CAMPEP_0116135080 /NCGR_PEP_ID=MMETSP0329-20121206/10999_1 /TAXON_ID=697910 /ORGANISM="Pseudo-nitzschia arenysensis, Strain B593" /LENGTH=291 /DNA_ID=CAMNT_0003629855 /DNA_START=60 /DNA_END=935 /DNA_ORIENTATION=-
MTATEEGVEVTSPHAELLSAFATLKKEKQALVALTSLQKDDKEKLAKALEEEKSKVSELETKLKFKQASADCQIAEVESFSKETIQDAIEKNSKYSAKIADLELVIAQTKKDKEHLLERTAALARRDQLQKASLSAMAEEISLLTDKVREFQVQFATLATRSVQLHKDDIEHREESESMVKSVWSEEKKELTERISSLQSSCDKLKHSEEIMKDSYVETLTKHKEKWNLEKKQLEEQVKDLVSEKVTIETQVAEIAELLEKDNIERAAKPVEAEETQKDPAGVKEVEVYDQ